jgi:Na+-driven multidrug efflux pump
MTIANAVNISLDPLFIFTFDMGIEGAAVATLLGRVAASVFLFVRMKRSGGIFIPVLPNLRRIFFRYWKDIALIGLPVTLSSGSVALGFGWLNTILASFGNYAVVALMMSLRIEDFSFTVIIGVSAALTPFLAYNYGRRDMPRMMEGMKSAAIIASGTILLIASVIFFFPRTFINLFRPSPEAADAAVFSIRFAIASYPFIISQFLMNSLFVATGYSAFGTIAQLVRSILVRVPAAYIFALYLGIRWIWLFQPVSWLFGALMSWVFMIYLQKKIKNDFMLEEIKKC